MMEYRESHSRISPSDISDALIDDGGIDSLGGLVDSAVGSDDLTGAFPASEAESIRKTGTRRN